MLRHSRFLLVLAVAAAAVSACSSSDLGVTPRLSPAGTPPSMLKVKATDSLMALTDISYSDTAVVLPRVTPLAQDITVSAVIGREGGTLRIDAAGLVLDIPKNAVAQPTTITVTALKGPNVAYEFGPHGTIFAEPVRITQDLRATTAGVNPALLAGLHGAYFDADLDASYLDAARSKARIKENQLGYQELKGTHLKFYVGHFSGYIVALRGE